jgi:endonuclease/exonuclease/phosphatase (EEP) superfamily protein YafD
MKIVTYLASMAAIIFTFIPLIPSKLWFVRIFDFPRLQVSFLLIISLLAAIFFLDRKPVKWILIVLLSCSIVYQYTLISDYTFLSKKEVYDTIPSSDDNLISLLISNVYMENDNYKGLLDLVTKYKPDILLTLETNEKWRKKLTDLNNNYPYKVEYPLENTYGMLLFSRLDLLKPEVKFLIEDDIPSIHTKVKLKSGKIISLHAVHPEPPVPGESTGSEERDAELIVVAKEVKDINEPVIVAGDLNDVAWSHTTRLFQRISGLLDPRIGRGFYNTYNARIPLLRWPLDHIFHSKHFKLVKLEVLPNFDSDHFPVYIQLNYEEAANNQKEKKPEKDDMEEANETLEETE